MPSNHIPKMNRSNSILIIIASLALLYANIYEKPVILGFGIVFLLLSVVSLIPFPLDREKLNTVEKLRAGKNLLIFCLVLLAVFFIYLFSSIYFFNSFLSTVTGITCTALVVASMLLAIEGFVLLREDKIRERKKKNLLLTIGTVIFVRIRKARRVYLFMKLMFTTINGQLMIVETSYNFSKEERLRKGMLIPLRYNPRNPEQIMISFDENPEDLQHLLYAHWVKTGLITQKDKETYERGIKTVGVILSAQPTVNSLNKRTKKSDWTEMSLQVNVKHLTQNNYHCVTINKIVPETMLPFVQPSSVVEVFYIPERDNYYAIMLNLHPYFFGVWRIEGKEELKITTHHG